MPKNHEDYTFIDIETNSLGYTSSSFMGQETKAGPKPFLIQLGKFDDPGGHLSVYYQYVKDPSDLTDKYHEIIDSTQHFVGHNLLFDLPILMINGYMDKKEFMSMNESYSLIDTMNIMKNLDNLDSVALKHVGTKRLGIINYKELLVKEYMNTRKIHSYEQVPQEIMTPYAVEDIRLTALLYLYERALLKKYLNTIKGFTTDYITRDSRILKTVIRMKIEGLLVDADRIRELINELTPMEYAVNEEVSRKFPGVDILSNKQLIAYCEKESIPLVKKTDNENYAIDNEVLEDLVDKGYEDFNSVIEARKLNKVLNTYLIPFLRSKDEQDRLQGNYNIAFTRSTRFSSSNPNLQNIPRKIKVQGKEYDIRSVFKAPEGYKFVSIDYSQIELRLFTYYSKCKIMKDALANGIDLHASTAQNIFELDFIGDVTKEQRGIAKTINFGLLYGMGKKTLAKRLRIPIKKAEQYLSQYYKAYPEVTKIKRRLNDIFYKRAHYTQKGVGFIINATGHFLFLNKNYTALNYLIQSTGSDILKDKMIEVEEFLKDKRSSIIMTVHDELNFYMYEDELGLIEDIKAIMEAPVECRNGDTIALPVDVEEPQDTWFSK